MGQPEIYEMQQKYELKYKKSLKQRFSIFMLLFNISILFVYLFILFGDLPQILFQSTLSTVLDYIHSVYLSKLIPTLLSICYFILFLSYSLNIIQYQEQQRMLPTHKKSKLLIIDQNKPKVSFDQTTSQGNKNNLNFREMMPIDPDAQIRRRRSTFHYRTDNQNERCKRRSYKFSQTVKKTKKTTKFKNIWISKRGTRNFYIMENQDFVLIDEKNKDYRLYVILDGHGKYGKQIAETAAHRVVSKYSIDQKIIHKQNPELNTQKIMRYTIEQANKYISQVMSKQVANSGCTLLCILIRDQNVYCFNIGSSRAILSFKASSSQKLFTLPLSSDHNLNRFDQRSRIMKTDAVFEELKDQNGCRVGPERIWKKGEKYPGIYITRSLGMRLSEQLGIISEPETTCVKIRPNFEFILACSDGFWEVFSNEDAVDYLKNYWNEQNMEQGIDNLLDQAVRRWDKKSQLMDDITIVVIRI